MTDEPKQAPPTKRGFRVLSVALKTEEADAFLSKFPSDLKVSAILRGMIRGVNDGGEIKLEGAQTWNVTMHVSPNQTPQGVPASVAVLNESVQRTKMILSQGGKIPTELRNEVKKDLRDCKRDKAVLPEGLAADLSQILDLRQVVIQ
jgi:hypothetical protein